MTASPFEILEIRSSGAYAAVCLARRTDDPLARPIGLKVLRATLIDNPQILTRTRDEARVLSMLNHPNIVKVEELLGIQRRPVMVMEWIEGASARELLDRSSNGLPWDIALEIIFRTCRALSAAETARDPTGHPLRILHRDIKPGNVLVSTHGQVKVVDFGLSRGDYFERETSTVSTLLGSMGYMAPERFLGPQPSTSAIDVYSSGITLAELLCGRLPVLPRDPSAHPGALHRYLEHVVPHLDPPIGTAVRSLIADMCDASPDRRPDHRIVQSRIREILDAAGQMPDLTRYADDVVKPLYQERPRLSPREHPVWDELQFLEDPSAPLPARLEADAQGGAQDLVDGRIRAFLHTSGWESRKRELKWLLALNPTWQSEPFLEVLQRGTQPWWRFWTRAANDTELAVALEVLKHRLSPRLVDMARGLVEHPNPRVAKAAQMLVKRYDSEN